jgi:hypothetical protein
MTHPTRTYPHCTCTRSTGGVTCEKVFEEAAPTDQLQDLAFGLHTHADFIFPGIEELQGDTTMLWTEEAILKILAAARRYGQVIENANKA